MTRESTTFGTIRRAIIIRLERVQTYVVFTTLSCGHQSSYTYSARSTSHKHPKSTGCYVCWKEAQT